MAVFKMDKEFNVVLNKEAVKLVPELQSLKDDLLLYVILVIDYVDGPFRRKPIDERRLMAKKRIWGDVSKKVETDQLRLAMKGYKSLVFDIRRETIDIYKDKIKKMHKETLIPDIPFSRMKEIDAAISFLQDRITDMEKELDLEESNQMELKGQKKLSYIEIWQKRQHEYAEYLKAD